VDTEEVVDLILEAFHTTVSDDDYVNEQSARANIWDLVEKYGDAVAATESAERDSEAIDELRVEISNLQEDKMDLQKTVQRLQARLEEAEVQLA
jgi:uncharacterized protein YlxW (UPF0749 family)